MRVLVTGATGFIGSAIVRDLIAAGHEVTGLVRSADAAERIEADGAKARRGTIEDLNVLRQETAAVDGVIHTAFFHAFSQASLATRLRVLFGGSPTGIVRRFMTAAVEADRRAIQAFGEVLREGGRPLVVAFPTLAMQPGRESIETDDADPTAVGGLRVRSEKQALAAAAHGVRTSIIRLPPAVHDASRQGLVTQLAAIARKKGISAYVGEGTNRWTAVHRLDAARLFRLALEHGDPGARYHAIGESPIMFREIAETIGRHVGVQAKGLSAAEAARHFGWLSPFVSTDNPVSSRMTRERLGWSAANPVLLTDLATALMDGRLQIAAHIA